MTLARTPERRRSLASAVSRKTGRSCVQCLRHGGCRSSFSSVYRCMIEFTTGTDIPHSVLTDSLASSSSSSSKNLLLRPPTRGDPEPRVLRSSEPTPEETLRRGGAQGGSGSHGPSWIPNRGVQVEAVQLILRSTYTRAGRRAACCDRRHQRRRGGANSP